MFNHPHTPALVLLVSSILWGLSWLPLKLLADMGVDGPAFFAVAYIGLFLLTLPWVIRNRNLVCKHWRAFVLIGLSGGLANFCFNYAFMYGQILRVMAMFYLLPVWGVLGGYLILGERVSLLSWLGVVLAISGAAVILGVEKLSATPIGIIDLLAVASGMLFAVTIMVFRSVHGVGVMLKISPLFLGVSIISFAVWATTPPHFFLSYSVDQWLVCLAITFGWLFWASLGTNWAAIKLPAGRSSIIMVTELVAATLSAVWIGGESFSLQVAVGGAMILTATVFEIYQAMQASQMPLREV